MSTFMAKPETIPRGWFVIDADRPGGRPAGGPDRQHPARQASARIYAARRYRRVRHRHQRREGPLHRQEAAKPRHYHLVHPLSRRPEALRRPATWMARRIPTAFSRSRAPHGAAQQPRPAADDQAEDLRRRPASAPSPDNPQELKTVVTGELQRHGQTTAKKTAYLGTGRRKTSVARVRLTEGTGKITINGRTVEELFHRDQGPQRGLRSAGS